MLRSFLVNKKLIVFVISMLLGGLAYLTYAFISIRKAAVASADPKIGNLDLKSSRFEGEFQLFAVADKPVDLGYDELGSIYFLNQNGRVVKIDQSFEKPHRLVTFFQITSDQFLKKKGCTSIAFHPDFLNQNTRGFGKFYVSVAERKGTGPTLEFVAGEESQEVVYEFASVDPLAKSFTASKREVLRLSRSASTTGPSLTDLTFDKLGQLYIGIADLPDEEESQASNLSSVYGKVLRIDPLPDLEKNTPYHVPTTNPFFSVANCLPELWSFGLRNPHTVSYDHFREWVCISDTGREMLEEINVSDIGAEFFGWNVSEGSFFYPPSAAIAMSDKVVSSPQIEYARGKLVGRNVGGFIYRGERFPYLDGNAVFADERGLLLTGVVTPHQHTAQLNVLEPVGMIKDPIQCLKEGPNGEIFVFCRNGKIYELKKARPVQKQFRSVRFMMASISLQGLRDWLFL